MDWLHPGTNTQVTTLKIDPWDPEYGGSIEIEEDQNIDPDKIDATVEQEDWAPIQPSPPPALPRLAFIDGVRRIDIRLFAENERGQSAPAIAGSWAAGVAWGGVQEGIAHPPPGRELIVGGDLDYHNLEVDIGRCSLEFQLTSVPETGFTSPIQRLQNYMREGESQLARQVFEDGQADIILTDGPLTRFTMSRLDKSHDDELDLGLLFRSVVGVIKRQQRSYLNPDQAQILGKLQEGQRTPLFLLKGPVFQRYSWYTRIANLRPSEGVMTGIIRLEVTTDIGATAACNLADITTSVLPRFATKRGQDPRAPQNLYPVRQLEKTLRRHLGDSGLVRRALETEIWRHNDR